MFALAREFLRTVGYVGPVYSTDDMVPMDEMDQPIVDFPLVVLRRFAGRESVLTSYGFVETSDGSDVARDRIAAMQFAEVCFSSIPSGGANDFLRTSA